MKEGTYLFAETLTINGKPSKLTCSALVRNDAVGGEWRSCRKTPEFVRSGFVVCFTHSKTESFRVPTDEVV